MPGQSIKDQSYSKVALYGDMGTYVPMGWKVSQQLIANAFAKN